MLLQRQYEGDQCTGVLVKHTGLNPEQNFSHRLVEQGMADGWIKIEGSILTMMGEPEDLVYSLKRAPGYYCKSSGEAIPVSTMAMVRMRSTGIGDLTRKEAQAWLLAHGKASDDYEVTNAYHCVLNDAQHEKFRAVAAVSGNLVAAGTLA